MDTLLFWPYSFAHYLSPFGFHPFPTFSLSHVSEMKMSNATYLLSYRLGYTIFSYINYSCFSMIIYSHQLDKKGHLPHRMLFRLQILLGLPGKCTVSWNLIVHDLRQVLHLQEWKLISNLLIYKWTVLISVLSYGHMIGLYSPLNLITCTQRRIENVHSSVVV